MKKKWTFDVGKISEWTFFWDQKKKELSEWTKNEKKTNKFIFFIFFRFFSFFSILQIWSDMKVHSRNWLNMKVHFFPFWNFDQQDGSLCSILLSLIFFGNFEKSEIVFLKIFFLFLDF